jgi:hypothetical protein
VSGQLGQIQVRLHQVDVTRLPLQRFLPQPRERILKGRVERLVFDATEARLNDLPLTRFVITVTDLRFDLLYALKEHDFRITDVDEARVEAMITARDLEAYLSARMPPIKEPHLELSLEGIHLTAHADFGLLEAPLELTGRLAMAPPKEVHLLDSQLWLNKLPVPAALARTLLGKINPLLDLDQLTDLPLPILLEELEAQPGQVVFRGHLETKGDREHESLHPW